MSSWCVFSSETTHGYKSQKSSTEPAHTATISQKLPRVCAFYWTWWLCSSTLLCTQTFFLFLPLIAWGGLSSPVTSLQTSISAPGIAQLPSIAAAEKDFLAHLFRARKPFPEFPSLIYLLARIVSIPFQANQWQRVWNHHHHDWLKIAKRHTWWRDSAQLQLLH